MASKSKKPAAEESGFEELKNRFKAQPLLFAGTVFILVIVIIAFVFLPALPGGIGGGQNVILGYYNGVPIAYVADSYFQRTLDDIAASMQFDLESDSRNDSSTAQQIWYQAFIRTLVHTAILDEMKSAGYTAPVREIDRQVAELPVFQEEGRFSSTRFREFDKNKFLVLWRDAEEAYITRKYIDSVMDLKVSSGEKTFIGAMTSPERSFEMVSVSRSAYPDSELSSFAAANPDLFRVVHFSRITLEEEKAAAQVLDSIQSGKSSFEDAARNRSADSFKDRGGDMGPRMIFEMFTELSEEGDREKIFSLPRGEISPVLKTPSGWTFFRAEEAPYAPDMSTEENLAKVRTYMNKFEGGRIEGYLIARMEELSARAAERGQSLFAYVDGQNSGEAPDDSAAGFTGLVFGPVNLNYGNMGGQMDEWNMRLFVNTLDVSRSPELADAAFRENFWRIAFSTPLTVPSAPFTLGDSIVVLRATEETFTDETTRENVAKFYSQGWMYNTLDMDLNSAFIQSPKFESNFVAALPFIFQEQF
ncbi:MAG: peptidylprolyl isomerase [Spirochaetaceae bacterium]|jgi:hypothetical protein|nr:peptidylprolyl isomerase [Spirochaetaceae bacterium]